MRTRTTLALLALFAAPTAWALPTSVKALAQFDVGYAACEKTYAHMRGHQDEAYVAAWKRTLNATIKEQLVTARKSVEYKSERKNALARMEKNQSPDTAARLDKQCQALWREVQLAPKSPS